MDRDLQKRIRFFQENAGYSTPPGRMVCAKSLALAEIAAEERGWIFQWDEDGDADWSWMDETYSKDYRERSYMLHCALREPDEDGTVLASLSGIHFLRGDEGENTYPRVVEAELACEALADEKRSIQETARVIAACAL